MGCSQKVTRLPPSEIPCNGTLDPEDDEDRDEESDDDRDDDSDDDTED